MLLVKKNHQEALPLLAFLVRVVFAIPVASSKSERAFSVADNIVSSWRALVLDLLRAE